MKEKMTKQGVRNLGNVVKKCPDCGQEAGMYKYCNDCRERRLQKLIAQKDKKVGYI